MIFTFKRGVHPDGKKITEDKPLEEYSITFPSTDYELVMRRKKPKQECEPIE